MRAAELMDLCLVSTLVSWLPAQVMPRTSTNFLEAAARPIPGSTDSINILSSFVQSTRRRLYFSRRGVNMTKAGLSLM